MEKKGWGSSGTLNATKSSDKIFIPGPLYHITPT